MSLKILIISRYLFKERNKNDKEGNGQTGILQGKHRHTRRQQMARTVRQIDTETDRQNGGQAGRYMQIDGHMDIHYAHRQTDGFMRGLANRLQYRQTDTHRQKHTDRYAQTDTHRQIHTDRNTQTDTHRQIHTDRYKQTDTHRQIHTDRNTQTDTHRQIHTDRYTQTDTHRQI